MIFYYVNLDTLYYYDFCNLTDILYMYLFDYFYILGMNFL